MGRLGRTPRLRLGELFAVPRPHPAPALRSDCRVDPAWYTCLSLPSATVAHTARAPCALCCRTSPRTIVRRDQYPLRVPTRPKGIPHVAAFRPFLGKHSAEKLCNGEDNPSTPVPELLRKRAHPSPPRGENPCPPGTRPLLRRPARLQTQLVITPLSRAVENCEPVPCRTCIRKCSERGQLKREPPSGSG